MDTDQNWFRQLMALALLAGAKAAVEFITNPKDPEDIQKQVKGALASVDYDALARAFTRAIDDAASTTKSRLSETIDTVRDRGVEMVDDAKDRAQKETGQRRRGRKLRFLVGLTMGALIAYFVLDEQRRDELLDRMTGASGPIQSSTQQWGSQAANTAQQANNVVQQAADTAQQAARTGTTSATEAEQKAADTAKQATESAGDAAQKATQTAADKSQDVADKASDTTKA